MFGHFIFPLWWWGTECDDCNFIFISIIHAHVILVPTSQALQVHHLQNENRAEFCTAKPGNEATRIVMFFTLSSVHAS